MEFDGSIAQTPQTFFNEKDQKLSQFLVFRFETIGG